MSKWFSVKKCLPNQSGNYLVFSVIGKIKEGQIFMCWFNVGHGWNAGDYKLYQYGITYWTHLPDKPNEDNVDNE